MLDSGKATNAKNAVTANWQIRGIIEGFGYFASKVGCIMHILSWGGGQVEPTP